MTTEPPNNGPIESLPNLGPKSGQWLREVGIDTVADLQSLGPVAAYRLVKHYRPKVSLNLLWALAAGLKNQDWRSLTQVTKRRLRRELDEHS